ncbi:fimbrillin family protein [Prevotella herbatica]|uniref:receptor protein-tyrosine kinase n=1 Tax=Prevotella herbatica TaxID=2801997 RepID=A0ABM7NZB4_9BACT|nr:fimbrillin family protein [Prevotella herbatica]BCS85837.1 fimbrillin family protein [Prevotella herbatica]
MVKKYLRGINVSFLLLIIISTFSSCANEMNIFEGNNNKQINFLVSVPEWKNTDSLETTKTSRSTPITDTSFGTDKTFGMIADVSDESSYTTEIDKETIKYNTVNKMWETTADHYWSGTANKTMNFYAYSPTSIFTNISHTAGFAPTLSYTVPDNVSDQLDIMTATNNNVIGNTNSSTPLTFNHIFAAVNFAVGTNGLPSGIIKSITISGIKNSGTYTFGSGWTLGSTTSLFTVSPSTTITGTSGENITSDAFTLMMIPQVFTNATVSLVYNNGTTFSAKISGTWNTGEVYTYKLSKTIVFNYDYTGASQTFTAPCTGTYKIECWGASGGNDDADVVIGYGGKGGYTKGYIKVNYGQIFYVCVGRAGILVGSDFFNGGGISNGSASGGGATDIRLDYTNWNDFESLKSRIMVAGGGGGGENASKDGGAAGGINGYSSKSGVISGGAQTAGYGFGIALYTLYNNIDWGGGGNGYYSGYSATAETGNTHIDGGGGGSSFISGYSVCNAIDKSSTSGNIIHTGLPNHYSGYIFTNSQMIDGASSMPSPTGGTETGHAGNGYARITFVSAN